MPISYVRRLRDLAAARPDFAAVVCGDDAITRAELVAAADDLAVELRSLGVGLGDMVTIALPNCVDWFVAAAACWVLGATPQPVSPRLPARELEAIVELADRPVVIGVEPGTVAGPACLPRGHRPPPGARRRSCPISSPRRGRRRPRAAPPGRRS